MGLGLTGEGDCGKVAGALGCDRDAAASKLGRADDWSTSAMEKDNAVESGIVPCFPC